MFPRFLYPSTPQQLRDIETLTLLIIKIALSLIQKEFFKEQEKTLTVCLSDISGEIVTEDYFYRIWVHYLHYLFQAIHFQQRVFQVV